MTESECREAMKADNPDFDMHIHAAVGIIMVLLVILLFQRIGSTISTKPKLALTEETLTINNGSNISGSYLGVIYIAPGYIARDLCLYSQWLYSQKSLAI